MLRTPAWAQAWTVLRLAIAALLLFTIVMQAASTIGNAQRYGWDIPLVLANFFSYFTILSNVIAVLVLAWAAGWFWMRGRDAAAEPLALSLALASATTYMVVTGVVYNLLLRGIALPGDPWTNEVLHVVGPVFLLLDVFFAPRRRRLGWGAIGVVAAFPVVWVVYTLLRGPLVTAPTTGTPYWYPYPFLDPHMFENGYVGVALYVIVIALVIVAVAAGVVWVARRRGHEASPPM